MNSRQLTKSANNRMLTGTIGGIGEYFGLNRDIITFIRIIYVILAFSSLGSLILLYIIASVIIPSGDRNRGRYRDYQDRYDHDDRYEDKWERKRQRWENKARHYEDKWSSGPKSNGGWNNPWENPTNSSGSKMRDTKPVEKEDDWSDF